MCTFSNVFTKYYNKAHIAAVFGAIKKSREALIQLYASRPYRHPKRYLHTPAYDR